MAVRKAKIGDSIYDVISIEEYDKNPSLYRDCPTAIEGGDGFIYPIRNSSMDQRPGFFDAGPMQFFNPPMGRDCVIYSDRNMIDFSKASSIKDVIESQAKLASAEREILTTIDNVFIPVTTPEDTPEMSLLKQAITDKHIDLDKYEQRFGQNFNNDKRLIKKSSITFGKLRNICNALDIKATLTLEDKDDKVPNPMKTKINVCLTDGFNSDEESEEENK